MIASDDLGGALRHRAVDEVRDDPDEGLLVRRRAGVDLGFLKERAGVECGVDTAGLYGFALLSGLCLADRLQKGIVFVLILTDQSLHSLLGPLEQLLSRVIRDARAARGLSRRRRLDSRFG